MRRVEIPIAAAARATVETLENRQLLTADIPHISVESSMDRRRRSAPIPASSVMRTGPTDLPLTIRASTNGTAFNGGPDRDHTSSVRTDFSTSPFTVGRSQPGRRQLTSL